MHSALGVIAVLLVFNLALSAPLGVTDRAHRDQALDWVFPHLHLHTDAPPAAAAGSGMPTAAPPGRAAWEAGSGLDSPAPGLGLTPPLPLGAALDDAPAFGRLLTPPSRLPAGWIEAPPDPPPTAAD